MACTAASAPAGSAEPAAEPGAEAAAEPSDVVAVAPPEDLLQWTWADSWALPGAQLLQWSTARSAEELAAELEAQEGPDRPVQVYSTSRCSTSTFASAASAAKRLRDEESLAVQEIVDVDFAKPPAITGMGDILSLGALSLTLTTATTLGLALSPVLIAKHMTQVLFSNLAVPCIQRSCCALRPLDTAEKMSIDDFRDTDRHWDSLLRVRRREPGNQPLQFPDGVVRRAMYVKMSDGVEIAVDILLPPPPMGHRRCPCIVQFARYWRAYEIRWPLRGLINNGEPWDFMHGETKSELLLAGFAWVSADVRGCGASGGMQNMVWSDREIADVLELIDFIVGDEGDNPQRPRQPWSDGRVAVYGVSYDAGVALRAAARGHPALKAVGAIMPFGDIWRELFPGGIMNRWFLETWSGFNNILDNASLAYVHFAAPVAVKGAAPAGPRESHDAAIATHKDNWDLVAAARKLVGIDSTVELPEGQTLSAQSLNLWEKHKTELKAEAREESGRASPEAVFPALAATGLPVLLVSGWMCVTVPTICQAFTEFAKKGWRLILGPWNHGGAQHYRYARGSRPMQFPMAADTAAFFLRHMPPESPDSPATPLPVPVFQRFVPSSATGAQTEIDSEAFFYVGGASPGWAHSLSWPPPGVRKRPLWLTAGGALSPKPPEQVDEATQLPQPTGISGHLWAGNSRYVTMIKAMDPLGYTWQDPAPDTFVLYESGPLEETVTVVGSPVVSLCMRSTAGRPGEVLDRESQEFLRLQESELGPAASDADVFVYLCARSASGSPPVYITEGKLRLSHRYEADQPSEVASSDCPVADDEISRQAAAADGRRGKEPFHTFLCGDKMSLPAFSGAEFRARMSLLPVGYRFDRGTSIVLVVTADDAAHFAPNPTLAAAPGSTMPSICHGPRSASLLWLPVLPEHKR